MTPRWLRGFSGRLRCSASFLIQMDAQLAPEFHRRTGLTLGDYTLAPHGPEDMYLVHADGMIRFVRGALAGLRLGHAVTIAWRDPAGRRAIATTDVVRADDVAFSWLELPAEEIQAEAATVPVAPFDVARFSFPIRYALHVWPHVRLTVAVRDDLDDVGLAALVQMLDDVQRAWNADPERHGTIHQVGAARCADPRGAIVEIDVGSAGPPALVCVLERLDELGPVAAVEITAY